VLSTPRLAEPAAGDPVGTIDASGWLDVVCELANTEEAFVRRLDELVELGLERALVLGGRARAHFLQRAAGQPPRPTAPRTP